MYRKLIRSLFRIRSDPGGGGGGGGSGPPTFLAPQRSGQNTKLQRQNKKDENDGEVS